MEEKHCKWYNDEFCTNGDSPCVADYCPVVEYPELCKHRERDKDINVRSKLTDEKSMFNYIANDVLGAVKPLYLRKRIIREVFDLIRCLQGEIAECEQKIADGEFVSKDWHDEQVLHDKVEIERLTEEHKRYAELFGMVGKEFFVVEVGEWEKVKQGVKDMIQQAVKDTAKEITKEIDDLTLCIIDGSDEFEKGYFQAITDMKTAIKDLIKERYGVWYEENN